MDCDWIVPRCSSGPSLGGSLWDHIYRAGHPAGRPVGLAVRPAGRSVHRFCQSVGFVRSTNPTYAKFHESGFGGDLIGLG